MTTTIVLASTNDGYIGTGLATWDDALNGSGATAVNGGTELVYGSDVSFGWNTYEAFLQFAYTRPTNEVEVGAAIGIRHSQIHNNTSCELWMHAHDFGATVDAADWVNPLAMATKTRNIRIFDPQASGTAQYIWAGSDELIGAVRAGGTANYRYVVSTNRSMTYGLSPSTDEWAAFWSAESSLDPTMVVSSVARSTLFEVLGAQVQLTDGTWVVLESDGATAPTVLLRHVDATGTATTKATVPVNVAGTSFVAGAGSLSTTGAQQFALVRDDSNNLYVIGWWGGTGNDMAVKAYLKGGGYTWTAATTVTATLPLSDTEPTNWAAAWHSVAGGTIVVLTSRNTSDGWRVNTTETVWSILDATAIRAGSSTFVRNAGLAVGTFTPTTSSAQWITQTNDTGSGLDVVALTSTKGVVHTWSRRDRLGANQATTKARYILNSAGTGFDNVFYDVPETSAGTWGVKTAAGKLRVVPVDSDTCAVVSADSDSGWGLTAAVLRNSGTTTAFTLLGRVRLGNESLTTMPTPATLAESQAWDATYVTGPRKLWVYYFSVADGRRLMRTAVSLNTYTATREEVQVNAAVGAVGSTNLALRVARGSISSRSTLITVANRTSGGTLSTIYLVDTPNEAPTAPTLASRSNFDGSASATFSWTFNDPDVGDTQSAFQLDINSASGVDYYDTGQLGAAITYVGASAVAVGSNASVAPPPPPGIAAGDLLVILASIRNSGTGTVNVPTKWEQLAVSGNVTVLGRIAKSGAASADNTPTVSFTGGVLNATTMARMFAWRGTDQNLSTVVAASAALLNGSAQNIAYPALTVPTAGCAVLVAGWKQDDWTSVAQLAGMTEIADDPTLTGDDAGQVADYVIQTTASNITASSFTVTGGAAAISRGLTLALRPHPTPTTASFSLPASTLTQPGSWQWRVRTWDAAGATGAWSAYSSFSSGVGGTVNITDPVADNPANIVTSYYPVFWSLTGATQAAYRLEVYRTDTSALVYSTGWVTSTSTGAFALNMLSDVEQRIEVTTRTAGLVESNVGTRLITPSYAAPDDPLLSVLEDPTGGHTLVTVTNPTAVGSRPAAAYTQILRRALTGIDTGEDWVVVGAVAPNGTWRDFTAAGAVTYEYMARAVAADDSTSDSDTAEATLALQGVWIHDPADPANAIDTARQWVYEPGGKTHAIDTMGSGTYYAGREFPVVEYGDQTAETLTVTAWAPHGETWLADVADFEALAKTRTTLCVRDTRGRRIFGTLSDISTGDETWGTTLTCRVTRVDYDETYTTIPS